MANHEEILAELKDNYELLCSIISQRASDAQLTVDLTKIEDIINKQIPDTLSENAPEDFYDLYTDFKAEYEKFHDFILYDKLIGKNIIALGGGFPSGKSSFLNCLMDGMEILPSDTSPSTSVPTYLIHDEGNSVQGINVFNAKIEIDPGDLGKIAHGFGTVETETGEKLVGETSLGHVMNSVFVSTEFQPYANIAFLDTPGYSKPDSAEYSARTDEQIARAQLNSANYILWFVQADAGTVTDADINFITTLREDTPKLIILNKADKRQFSDLKKILEQIRTTLTLKGIRYVDVLAYSDRVENVADTEQRRFIEQDMERIHQQLEAWDRKKQETNFARNFKVLFTRCKEYYEQEIDEQSKQLNRLNTSITKLMGENVDTEILEPLQAIVREARKNVNELNEIKSELKKLQDEFFAEIKYVADMVGIDMPEPSEIDLLQDRVKNPLQLIEEYRSKKGIASDTSKMVDFLQDTFDGIEPVINKRAGGTAYKDELLDVIQSLCDVKPENIRINKIV